MASPAADVEPRVRAAAEALIRAVQPHSLGARGEGAVRIDLRPLTGGLLNHVWAARVATSPCFCAAAHEPSEPCRCVIKYSPPYIASQPSIALDASRLVFESRALVHVKAWAAPRDPASRHDMLPCLHVTAHTRIVAIGVPHLLACDTALPLAMMSEFEGSHPLSEALLRGGQHAAIACSAVGSFLGWIHARSSAVDLADMRNEPIQRVRNMVQYHGMQTVLTSLLVGEVSPTVAVQREGFIAAAAALGDALATQAYGMCLIHGDAWLASFLLRTSGERAEVCAIDWEMAHFGIPAQDVAHFAAHMAMLLHGSTASSDAFDVSGDTWDACVEAYIAALLAHLPGESASRFLARMRHRGNARACVIHCTCELFARMGSFRSGYVFEHASQTRLEELAVRLLAHVADCLPVANALDAESGLVVAGTPMANERDAVAAYVRATLALCCTVQVLRARGAEQ